MKQITVDSSLNKLSTKALTAEIFRGKSGKIWRSGIATVSTKMVKSRDIGISATRKHNISVEIFKKFSSLCFKWFGRAHKHHKHCVLLAMPIMQPHPHVLSARAQPSTILCR